MKCKVLSALLVLSLLPAVPHRALARQLCAQAIDENDCQAKVEAPLRQRGVLATSLEAEEAKSVIATLNANEAEARSLVADKVARELLAKVSPEIAVLPGSSAALEDFLNRLRIGLTSEGTEDEQALALDFTDFLGLSSEDGYKLQAVVRDPSLFESLSTALSEENRDRRTKGLGAFDDVLVSFAYSPSTPRLGTNLGASQILTDELFSHFVAQNNILAPKAAMLAGARDNMARQLIREFPGAVDQSTGALRFAGINDPLRQQSFRDAVEKAAVAEANRLSSLHLLLTRSGFFRIADLVANQPQLVVKATGTVRDELAGPDETTLKISYEQGFVNMNSLRRKLANCRPEELTTCFTSYLTERRSLIAKAQNRITFSLDWTKQKDYDPTIDGVSLDISGKERWTIAASFGRNLRVDENGKFTSRIDLTGSWEDWSDDPLHQDRGLANLSFTQKVTNDMSLVLGAVWASKSEFRGEVDEEVSARFGFTYRFLDQKGKEVMRN